MVMNSEKKKSNRGADNRKTNRGTDNRKPNRGTDNRKTIHRTESEIQRRIMVAVSPYCAIFRAPAGMYYQGRLSRDGKTLTDLRRVRALAKGFPDLVGFRRSDGRCVLIEVKRPGGRATKEQRQLLKMAREAGALAGIARSEAEALEIVTGDAPGEMKGDNDGI